MFISLMRHKPQSPSLTSINSLLIYQCLICRPHLYASPNICLRPMAHTPIIFLLPLLFPMFTFGLSANHFPTVLRPTQPYFSLKLVNANAPKELQNVLPKCNPLLPYFDYHFYSVLAFFPPSPAGEGWGRGSPPHLNNHQML
jgi:hypothetical protein